MTFFCIEFCAICETVPGEDVYIAGNIPELGGWKVGQGLKLTTNSKKYPHWTSSSFLKIKEETVIEFKLCIMNQMKQLIRWEELVGNRRCCPRGNLLIEFVDSESKITYRLVSQHEPVIENVRKKTKDILRDLSSDNSSNNEIWKEHMQNQEEEDSALLSQFASNLRKVITTQKENALITLQNQPLVQLSYLSLYDGFYHLDKLTHHYFLVPHTLPLPERPQNHTPTFHFIRQENIQSLIFLQGVQLAIFHLRLSSNQNQIEPLSLAIDKSLNSNIQKAKSYSNLFKVLYLETMVTMEYFQRVIIRSFNSIVVNSYKILNHLLEELGNRRYEIVSIEKDIFSLELPNCRFMKIFYENENYEQKLNQMNPSVIFSMNHHYLEGYFFPNPLHKFEKELKESNSFLKKMKNTNILFIVECDKLENLPMRTINDLIALSVKPKFILFVFLHESFSNIKRKFPLSMKDKVIFVNTFGQIYANGQNVLSIFELEEILVEDKFKQSFDIILQNIGCDFNSFTRSANSLKVKFNHDTLGSVLKRRMLKFIQSLNKRSLAKISVKYDGQFIELVPFFLHPEFLYKIAVDTFAYRLARSMKGLVISLNANRSNCKNQNYLMNEIHTGILSSSNLKMKLVNLFFEDRKVSGCYKKEPVDESMMLKLLEIIHGEIDQSDLKDLHLKLLDDDEEEANMDEERI